MQAYEFPAKLNSEGKLDLPEQLLKELPINQELRVIVLVKETTDLESEDNKFWSRIAIEQFFSEEDDSDYIYDHI
jgi:hypothetical protein